MKLYNLYKQIILEAEDAEVNTDSVEVNTDSTEVNTDNDNMPCFGDFRKMTKEQIIDGLIEGCKDNNGNKYWFTADVYYKGESQPRYVFIHALGQFKGGIGIRAWQTSGPSKSAGRITHKGPPTKRQEKIGWRIFFLGEIDKIIPKNFRIYNPFDGYAGPDNDAKMINGKTIKGIKK